jgi:apolipoprotein N-acyltransferase
MVAHPLFFMVPMLVYNFFCKKFKTGDALSLLPFIWISYEWLRCWGDLSYPWQSVGYTQIYNYYWVQSADLAGVWGVSFMVLFVNILLAKALLVNHKERKENPGKHLLNMPGIKKYFIVIAIILVVPNIYGIIRVIQFNHGSLTSEYPSVRVALIQPNINPWRKWEHNAMTMIEKHRHIQDSIQGKVQGIDLAIWSETAITYVGHNFNFMHDFSYLSGWVDQTKANLMTGFADFYVYKPDEEYPPMAKVMGPDSSAHYSSFNSALLLQPGSSDYQVFHKMKLTPFSEKFPYMEVLAFAKSLFEWNVGISSWTPGKKQVNLKFAKGRDSVVIAPVICIESIYPYFVREFVNLGANMIAVITNDGWFDYTYGPEQHYLIAAMRAIENRRYVARVGNTGITGFIKPDGTTLNSMPQYTQGAIYADVPLLDSITPYYIFGDFSAILSTVLIIITLIYAFLHKRKQ